MTNNINQYFFELYHCSLFTINSHLSNRRYNSQPYAMVFLDANTFTLFVKLNINYDVLGYVCLIVVKIETKHSNWN